MSNRWPWLYYVMLCAGIVTAVACSNRPAVYNPADERTDDIAAPAEDTGIISCHGIWLSQAYVTKLRETMSPQQAEGMELFYEIPERMNETGRSFTFHEGGGEYDMVRNGDYYFMKPAGEASSSDDKLVVPLEDGRIMIDDKPYVRVQDGGRVAEELLFEGTYAWNDTVVSLSATGTVGGLAGDTYYEVQHDYNGPGFGDNDLLRFRNSLGEENLCVFKFAADTLFIYGVKCGEINENGGCNDIQKADIKYTLIKRNAL